MGREFQIMAAHLIDVTEVAASGGTVRFYQPGTLTQANVFSNDAATIILSQPVALDQNGKTASQVYSTAPVRAIYFDSGGAQILDSERANGERAEIVSLVNTRWPSSSTADQAFTALALSLGSTDGNSAASFTGAIPRTVQARLQDQFNVKDFGCKGDGVTLEDAAWASAVQFVATRGVASVLRVPAGTYLFSQGWGAPVGTNNNITIQGEGRGSTILKANAFTVNNFVNTGGVGFDINFKDLTITNSSTSTGIGLSMTGRPANLFFNIEITGFRTGLKCDGIVVLCKIVTDNNAAASNIQCFDGCTALLCQLDNSGGAGIRVPSGAGGNGMNAIANSMGATGGGVAILYENGNVTFGGFIAGNTVTLNGSLITATAGTRGIPGVKVVGNSGSAFSISENAASTDIITNPVAGTLTLNLSTSRYIKATLVAATAITFNVSSAPFHDDIYTVVLQNGTGGGFAITAGASTVIQTGGFTVAATSQSVIHMQYDSNASKLIQVSSPVAMAVT
jgi:hypothetical protein